MISNIKKKIGRNIYHMFYADNWFFGFLFDLFFKYYKTENCKFYIPRNLQTVGFRTRFFFNTYERDERILVKKYINSQYKILELGACMGLISCITNNLLTNKFAHVVVEANPNLIDVIETNKKLNDAGFHIEHGLVSNTSDGRFYIHDLIVGGSANRKTNKEVKVPVKTIGEIIEKYDTVFDAIIMDIEGGEIDFIKENILYIRERVKLLIIEFHPFISVEKEIYEVKKLLEESNLIFLESINNSEVWLSSN